MIHGGKTMGNAQSNTVTSSAHNGGGVIAAPGYIHVVKSLTVTVVIVLIMAETVALAAR